MPHRPLPILCACAALAAAGSAAADAPRFGFDGTLTLGQMLRDSPRNAELLNRLNAAALGVAGSASGGRNQDDGNLNFEPGDAVSTVLKLMAEARLEFAPFTLLVSGKAWHDFTLGHENMPWGNLPNGLRSDRPLSDAGFARRSQFSGAVLQQAYLQLDRAWGGASLRWRFGQQALGWGGPSLLGSGVRLVDAVDLPSTRRPGNLAAENSAPALALRGTASWASGWSLDGFAQFSFEPNASTVCGTFQSVADYLDGGCDKAILGASADDRSNLAAGSFMRRAGVLMPSGRDQFGLAAGFASADGRWAGKLYAAQIAHRVLTYNMIKTRRSSGAPVVAGDPGGLNAMYEVEYARGLQLFGIDAQLQAWGGTLYGELSHSPNHPVPLNSGDLVSAFASTASTAALLRADERATPLGGRYRGYDRLQVSDARLGWSAAWPALAGLEELQWRMELVAKLVHDLPDVTLRRYRRPDVYGNGPIAGVCTGTPGSKQCSSDGYVTAAAYGLRTRLSGRWRLSDQLTLSPTLSFGQDLHGWSFDNALGQGRRLLGGSLRLAGQKAFAEFALQHSWGNPYDNAGDRDSISLSVGTRF